jgi:hypothetical protein
VGDAVRRNIATGQEAHAYGAGLLDELRLWVPCLDAQLNDLLGAATPSFYQSPPIEDFRY